MPGIVSIVTRTLGRPCLADAAASVAAQTLPPLEWVVVDAAGRGLDAPSAGAVPVRVVTTGSPLRRSLAANAGLDAVQGTHALILDDDDLLRPTAVERLVGALNRQPSFGLAYGDVDVVDAAGHKVGLYAFEYSELLVTRRNLFPPHAALFDVAMARDAGARFDATLDWYEDWDFWLTLSQRTAFLHVREVLADYRLHLSQSGIASVDEPGADPRIRAARDVVIARGAARRTALESRHDALKRDAAAHAAAGRLPQAAAAWAAAHQDYHYDAEPILRYAELATRAGDARAACTIVESGLALLPAEPVLHRARAALLERTGDRTGAAEALEKAHLLEAHGPHSPI